MTSRLQTMVEGGRKLFAALRIVLDSQDVPYNERASMGVLILLQVASELHCHAVGLDETSEHRFLGIAEDVMIGTRRAMSENARLDLPKAVNPNRPV